MDIEYWTLNLLMLKLFIAFENNWHELETYSKLIKQHGLTMGNEEMRCNFIPIFYSNIYLLFIHYSINPHLIWSRNQWSRRNVNNFIDKIFVFGPARGFIFINIKVPASQDQMNADPECHFFNSRCSFIIEFWASSIMSFNPN